MIPVTCRSLHAQGSKHFHSEISVSQGVEGTVGQPWSHGSGLNCYQLQIRYLKGEGPFPLHHFLSSRTHSPAKDVGNLLTYRIRTFFSKEKSHKDIQQYQLRTQDTKSILHVKQQCTLESITQDLNIQAYVNLDHNEGVQTDGGKGDFSIK